MLKKLNNLINYSLIFSLIFIIIGVLMIIFPKISLNVFNILLALLLLLNGITLIILNIQTKNIYLPIDTIISGILSITLGSIMLLKPNTILIILPTVLGTWFILSSMIKFRWSFILKEYKNSSWLLTFILAILSTITSIILIINPTITSFTITVFAGMMITIYSISDTINLIILKKHIKDISKYYQNILKGI